MDGSFINIRDIFFLTGKEINTAQLQEPIIAFEGEIDHGQHLHLHDTPKSKIVGINYAFVHENVKPGENQTPPLMLIFAINTLVMEHSGTSCTTADLALLKQSMIIVKLAVLNPTREDREATREEKLFKGELLDEDRTGIFFTSPAGVPYRVEHKELAKGVAERIFFGPADNITESVDMTQTIPEDPLGREDEDEEKSQKLDKHFAWGRKIVVQAVRVISDTKSRPKSHELTDSQLRSISDRLNGRIPLLPPGRQLAPGDRLSGPNLL